MEKVQLFWLQVGALSQAAAAFATFVAVVISLYVAFSKRKPRLRITVGERLFIGEVASSDTSVLAFSIINAGDRMAQVRTVGWHTGWIKRGPQFIKVKTAIQMTGGVPFGSNPPFDIAPGMESSCYCLMDNVVEYAKERSKETLFTRDWPLFGRRRTRVLAFVHTADGHSFYTRAERPFVDKIVEAELASINRHARDAAEH